MLVENEPKSLFCKGKYKENATCPKSFFLLRLQIPTDEPSKPSEANELGEPGEARHGTPKSEPQNV